MMTKHGDVNQETGKVFVGYYKSCKNGEWWLSRSAFDARYKKRADAAKKRYSENENLRNKLQARCREWGSSEAGRKYDRARQGAPENLKKRSVREAKRKTENPVYLASIRVRNKLSKVLKAKRMSRSKTMSEIIGMDWDLFDLFISSQFSHGMTWGNIGEWHIDHFIPMSSARTKEDVMSLSHYSNLRPLWAYDNLRKGDKVPSFDEQVTRNLFVGKWNRENNNPASMGEVKTQGMSY